MAAISQEQRTELLTLIVGMFDGAPSKDQFSELSNALVDGSSMEDVAGILVDSEQFDDTYPGFLTAQDFAERLADNILGETVSAQTKTDAINLVVSLASEEGATLGSAALEAINLLREVDLAVNPEWTEAQAILLNKAEVAKEFALSELYTDSLTTAQSQAILDGVTDKAESVDAKKAAIADGTILTGGSASSDLNLQDGRDNLVGTSGDDTFIATVGQNQDGASANAFSTGDILNGSGGRDTLKATVIDDYNLNGGTGNPEMEVRAETTSIEEVYLEAIDDVVVDAARMSNVEEYWSNFSEDNLEIRNVSLRGNNLQITDDLTFGLRDTNADTDFTALIESPALTAAPDTVSNSQLSVQIADVSTETPATPLANVNMDLGFTIGGQSYVLEDLQADGGTYAGLITAVQTALAGLGLGDLEVSAGNTYNQVTFANNTVTLPFTATELLVSDPDGGVFSDVTFQQNAIDPVAGGFLVAGTAAPVAPTSSSNVIETNLILDYAGRGSIAGEVHIGGQSQSTHGVEKIDVTVDRDSAIDALLQTVAGDATTFIADSNGNNSQLNTIVIDSMGANGDLTIGQVDDDLTLIQATAFEGDNLTIGTGTGNAAAVDNLRTFNSAGTDTNVTLNAAYDGSGLASSAQSFTINTGTGNDKITASLEGLSNSNSTLTSLTVTSAGGNNTVTLSSGNTGEANKADVTLGSGNDTVTGGQVHLNLDTNAGDDVVYAENTGATKTAAVINAGASAVGSTNETVTGVQANTVSESELLYGRQVRVTLDFDGVGVDDFTQGLESALVDIEASNGGYLTTERDLYNAIAKAINEDSVLSTLATASVDSNGHLTVTYKVDGVSTLGANAVQYNIVNDSTDLSSSEINNIRDALQVKYNDSQIDSTDTTTAYDAVTVSDQFITVTTAGSDAGTDGANTVNLGTGNDVLAFNSRDTAVIDTLVFDVDSIGTNTVVHFNDAANGDRLNFTAWLDNETTASGSTESQVRVATTVTTSETDFSENAVVLTDFNTLNGATTATLNFDSMTDAQVLAALNEDATFAADAQDATLVGSTQKSIMMVEDSGNAGEYKVYQVTSDSTVANDADAFTAATLIGTVDFGSQLTLDATNLV